MDMPNSLELGLLRALTVKAGGEKTPTGTPRGGPLPELARPSIEEQEPQRPQEPQRRTPDDENTWVRRFERFITCSWLTGDPDKETDPLQRTDDAFNPQEGGSHKGSQSSFEDPMAWDPRHHKNPEEVCVDVDHDPEQPPKSILKPIHLDSPPSPDPGKHVQVQSQPRKSSLDNSPRRATEPEQTEVVAPQEPGLQSEEHLSREYTGLSMMEEPPPTSSLPTKTFDHKDRVEQLNSEFEKIYGMVFFQIFFTRDSSHGFSQTTELYLSFVWQLCAIFFAISLIDLTLNLISWHRHTFEEVMQSLVEMTRALWTDIRGWFGGKGPTDGGSDAVLTEQAIYLGEGRAPRMGVSAATPPSANSVESARADADSEAKKSWDVAPGDHDQREQRTLVEESGEVVGSTRLRMLSAEWSDDGFDEFPRWTDGGGSSSEALFPPRPLPRGRLGGSSLWTDDRFPTRSTQNAAGLIELLSDVTRRRDPDPRSTRTFLDSDHFHDLSFQLSALPTERRDTADRLFAPARHLSSDSYNSSMHKVQLDGFLSFVLQNVLVIGALLFFAAKMRAKIEEQTLHPAKMRDPSFAQLFTVMVSGLPDRKSDKKPLEAKRLAKLISKDFHNCDVLSVQLLPGMGTVQEAVDGYR